MSDTIQVYVTGDVCCPEALGRGLAQRMESERPSLECQPKVVELGGPIAAADLAQCWADHHRHLWHSRCVSFLVSLLMFEWDGEGA